MGFYTNRFLISKDHESIFEKDRKHKLSTLEKFGLESILDDFVKDYNDEIGLETGDFTIKDFTRFNGDSVDILDGMDDTFIFDNFAFSEIWTTENGCICLSAIDLTKYTGNDPDEKERAASLADDCDFQEIVRCFDTYADFESVIFRLN